MLMTYNTLQFLALLAMYSEYVIFPDLQLSYTGICIAKMFEIPVELIKGIVCQRIPIYENKFQMSAFGNID